MSTELNIAVAELCVEPLYLIVKRGLYYRPGGGGYTNSVAEAWKLPLHEAKEYEMYVGRDDIPECEKVTLELAPIPDFANSLDACRSFEETLTVDERKEYVDLLWPGQTAVFLAITASAKERCIAFLKTKGITPNHTSDIK